MLIDFTAIVDHATLIVGEMVFVEMNGDFYLDGAHLKTTEALGKQHQVEVSERFSRKVVVIDVANLDSVTFNNLSDESMAIIKIQDANGETIFEGHDMAETMVGGDNADVFVAYDLKPGDYVATITFDQSGVTMRITFRVTD